MQLPIQWTQHLMLLLVYQLVNLTTSVAGWSNYNIQHRSSFNQAARNFNTENLIDIRQAKQGNRSTSYQQRSARFLQNVEPPRGRPHPSQFDARFRLRGTGPKTPTRLVPGSPNTQAQIVFQDVMPFDGYEVAPSESLQSDNSYVIDHKRFFEAFDSRCFQSTVLEDPSTIEPNFIIIKPDGERRLNATVPAEHVKAAGFDPRFGTTLVVHGFTQSYPDTEWLRKTRALFEKHALISKHNLIIMDWPAQGNYAAVAARVSIMSSYLANFLMKLIDLGQDRMMIHLIGHSLGAHLCGLAGKRIRPKIGRITSLDGAGPCFGKFFPSAPTNRLAPDDAYEVDAYHYDDSFLGLSGQHGQFDVFVNGGSKQPGCKGDVNAMFNALVTVVFRRNRVLSESHTRSTEVATGQLSLNGCQQVAYECRDFQAFTAGECGKCDEQNNQCFFMGFAYQYSEPELMMAPLRTAFPSKKFYILTGQSELFCANHYQIIVKFEPTPDMAQQSKRQKWSLHVELINDLQDRVNITMTHQMAPNIYSYLLLTDASKPTRIIGARLLVKSSDGSPVQIKQPHSPHIAFSNNKSPPIHRVLHMEINFMSHMNPQARRAMSSRLCPVPWSHSRPPPSPEDTNSIDDSSFTQKDMTLNLDDCMQMPPKGD